MKNAVGSIFNPDDYLLFWIETKKLEGRRPNASQGLDSMEGSVTVLLVEDDELVRNIAASMLTHLGCSVLEAMSRCRSVEIFGQRHDEISCILGDLTMSRMNGWETLSART